MATLPQNYVAFRNQVQADVILAVGNERKRQDDKWGDQSGTYDGTGPSTQPLLSSLQDIVSNPIRANAAALANLFTEATDFRAANRINGADMSDILLEEVFEALAEDEPDKLYTELIQVAAVATAWCEYIQRRGANPRPAVTAVVAA